jgi:hypothetical protein
MHMHVYIHTDLEGVPVFATLALQVAEHVQRLAHNAAAHNPATQEENQHTTYENNGHTTFAPEYFAL